MTSSQRSCTAALALLISGSALGADLTIENTNNPGAGFNNSTPATPQGLNFGTTTGEQALITFNTAAAIWGATIRSPVPIVIDSAFVSGDEDPRFTCTSDGFVLGYARLTSYQTSANFPVPTAGYVAALANALAGEDLTPGEAHIEARFNSSVGSAACPNFAWSYTLDGSTTSTTAVGQISLLTTLLHEFGHGLGYTSFVDPSSGAFGRVPAIWDVHTFDVDAGVSWAGESSSTRKTLSTTPGGIGFDGDAVRADMPRFLGHVPLLGFTPSGGIETTVSYAVGQFSGPIDGALSGPVVLTSPADACADLTQGSLAGKVALIVRGSCNFIDKANRAADAGAEAIVVYNNDAGPLVSMAGTPPVGVPAVFISQTDGQTVLGEVAGGVTAALTPSPALSNADPSQTRVLNYTPATLSPGSSVVHWNFNTYPRSLLMEYAISPDMRVNMDLTPAVMADLGWSVVQGLAVSVVKTLNPLIPAGGDATYLIAVVNRRPTAIATAVLDLALPAGAEVVSNQGACTGTFPCTLAPMAAGDVLLVVTKVHVPASASGAFAVAASLVPATADAGDNLTATSTQTVAAGGDVQVTASAPTQLTPGTPATFSVTVTNAGPGVASDLSVTASATGSNGTALLFNLSSGACSTSLPCNYTSLASGASQSFTASYIIPADFTGTATFTATATSATLDPATGNNTASASASTAVTPPPATKSSGCSTTGSAPSLVGLLGLAFALTLRRRSRAA